MKTMRSVNLWSKGIRSCAASKLSPTSRLTLVNLGRFAARNISSTASPSGENTAGGALRDIKVLDLSRVLAAPFCTQILADYGADVVKIEAVNKGDDTRHWRMPGEQAQWKKEAGPISNYFCAVNRNKRSVTLDLKTSRGKDIFLKLAKKCDVIIENFKPGTMDRLGLGYEKLRQQNPKVIYASLSGYGTSGPYANRGGYDPIAGAEAGLLHVTGERKGPPVRPGLGVIDMATGLYMHGAILAALHARSSTGVGQRVDTSLFETQLSMLTNVGLSWLNLGIEAERWGCQHPSIVPYDAFKTKDSYLVCGATNDSQFAALCRLVGLESIINDARFATNPSRVENREVLGPIFNDAFKAKTTAEWTKVFEGKDLAFAPINNMENTFSHPQAEARQMVAKVPIDAAHTGHVRLIGPPAKFSETKPSIRSVPPRLGQHTHEVLMSELGVDENEFTSLKQEGVI